MDNTFYRLMQEATELTRSGDLGAATQAIQRALKLHSGSAAAETAPAAAAGKAPGSAASANAGIILDGLTRIIADVREPAASTPPAMAQQGQAAPATKTAATPRASQALEPDRWIDASFSHKGRTLAYKLFVPAVAGSADRSAGRPLVVMLHGCTQGAADFAAGTRMNTLAKELGAMVLYPEQSQRANPQRCWNWFKPQHQQQGRGEPALLAALTQAIVADYEADAARVYVAGLSAGGAMADILGQRYPEVFAAVGVHSGLPCGAANDVMSALEAMRCGARAPGQRDARHAPPTIVFHGDADTTVHVSNGAAVVDAIRQSPGARLTSKTTQGSCAPGHRFTRTVYSNSAGLATVEYWQLHGAGHAWSGGSALGSYTNPHGVDASAEMLRFFMTHRRQAD